MFSPLVDDKIKCRLWNQQFISFAGYRQADGSVIGDPNNIEFTDICIKLGDTAMIPVVAVNCNIPLLKTSPLAFGRVET